MVIEKPFLTMVMALALLSAPAWLQAEEGLSVVNGIKVFRTVENEIAVEIGTDKKVEYTSYKMPDLLRVVVDLPGTQPAKPETVHRYKSVIVSDIRLEKRNINGVPISRVSINLADDADYRIQADPSDSTKLRLVLLKPAGGGSAGTVAAAPDAKTAFSGKPAAAGHPAKDVSAPAVSGTGEPATVTGVNCGADAIDILSSAGIAGFEDFTLQKPTRLVIDISGARSTLGSLVLPANRFGISKARIALYDGKLRMVFHSKKDSFPAYDVVKTATGLRIVSTAGSKASAK